MPYGSLLADVVQSSATGTPPQFNDTTGTQVGTLCRAWVNFNGTGTVAIRGSFNVSSITDNGTGDYTVNFTTAMPDVNYATLLDAITVFNGTAGAYTSTGYSTGSVRIALYGSVNSGGTAYDGSIVSVAVFR
jgi:hypothetical protein